MNSFLYTNNHLFYLNYREKLNSRPKSKENVYLVKKKYRRRRIDNVIVKKIIQTNIFIILNILFLIN